MRVIYVVDLCRYITYVADWFCLLAFSLEAVIKIKKRGMFNPETGYFR